MDQDSSVRMIIIVSFMRIKNKINSNVQQQGNDEIDYATEDFQVRKRKKKNLHIYYKAGYMSLYLCPNPQKVQH